MSSIATENQMEAVEIDESINKLNILWNDVVELVQISHRNLIKYANLHCHKAFAIKWNKKTAKNLRKIKSQFMNWNFSEKLCNCNDKPDKKMAQKHLENVYLLGYIVLVRDLIKSKPP
jgi:hypothetical protein